MTQNAEPGLAAALARGLDPDEIVSCWAANWLEGGRWHSVKWADPDEIHFRHHCDCECER